MRIKKSFIMLILVVLVTTFFTTMNTVPTYAAQSTQSSLNLPFGLPTVYKVTRYDSGCNLTTDIYYCYNGSGQKVVLYANASCSNPNYRISSISYKGCAVDIYISYVKTLTIKSHILYIV